MNKKSKRIVLLVFLGNCLFWLLMVPFIKMLAPEANPWLGIMYFGPITLIISIVPAIFLILTLGGEADSSQGNSTIKEPAKNEPLLREKLKRSTLRNLWLFTVMLILGSPFLLAFFVMAFDSPSSYENIFGTFLAIIFFGFPYLTLLLGWIFYRLRQYQWANNMVLAPIALFFLVGMVGRITGC